MRRRGANAPSSRGSRSTSCSTRPGALRELRCHISRFTIQGVRGLGVFCPHEQRDTEGPFRFEEGAPVPSGRLALTAGGAAWACTSPSRGSTHGTYVQLRATRSYRRDRPWRSRHLGAGVRFPRRRPVCREPRCPERIFDPRGLCLASAAGGTERQFLRVQPTFSRALAPIIRERSRYLVSGSSPLCIRGAAGEQRRNRSALGSQ